MEGWILWILILVFIVIAGVVQIKNSKNKEEAMKSSVNSLQDFTPTQQVMGVDGKSGLAVDEPNKKVCLITNNGTTVSQRIISYYDILSVELFEDTTSITKTVRSSQIGGAVVGGIIFGGVGAVVGGLSGKIKTSGKIKRIDLRLIVNDTKAPLHDIAFLDVEVKKDGFLYNLAIQAARLWHGIIEVLIKRADAEEKSREVSERQTEQVLGISSVADEIKKLSDLHNSGILTADEFQKQKARLLKEDTSGASTAFAGSITPQE